MSSSSFYSAQLAMVQADQHLGLRAVGGGGWGASRCWICVKMKYGSLQWGRWRARRQKQSILSSVQLLSRVQLLATLQTAVCQASLFIINFWSLLRLMPTELVMPFNHLTLCHPFLLPPSIFPSSRVFSNESILQHSAFFMYNSHMHTLLLESHSFD